MYDVAIVGAGPAGSTTARFAAMHGLKVIMLDKRREIGFPVQCGEFMPHNDEIKNMFPRCEGIDELFDVPESLISLRTETIRIYSPSGRKYQIGFKGYSIERRRFDKHLVELALKNGAELRTGTLVKDIDGTEVITDKDAIKAGVIVGTDGPTSKVAEFAGLPHNENLAPAITCRVEGDFEPVVKMWLGNVAPGGYAWIIPKRGSANVGLGVQRRFTNENVRTLFEHFMGSRGFQGQDITGGHVPVSGPLSATVKGNVILVGDAGGHLMASNGGGIPTGMICGRIAGEVIGNHIIKGTPLDEYEVRWRRAIGKELNNSLTSKRMADGVFGNDLWLSFAMRCLGRTGLARVIRCQRIVPW